MKNKKNQSIFGSEHIATAAKMTTTKRLQWLEKARDFALQTIPKSSLRAYLKIRNNY